MQKTQEISRGGLGASIVRVQMEAPNPPWKFPRVFCTCVFAWVFAKYCSRRLRYHNMFAMLVF